MSAADIAITDTAPAPPCGGCGLGVCDEYRGTCECPVGFEGMRCEKALLPDCMLFGHPIPIRSWVLHAFHDGAGRDRWPSGTRSIGPVPCSCLLQLVSMPFLMERTRLQYMRSFDVRCLQLADGVSLSQYVESPTGHGAEWNVFSFGAAHDALKLGLSPSLHEQAFDDSPRVNSLLHAVQTFESKGQRLPRRRIGGKRRAKAPPPFRPLRTRLLLWSRPPQATASTSSSRQCVAAS